MRMALVAAPGLIVVENSSKHTQPVLASFTLDYGLPACFCLVHRLDSEIATCSFNLTFTLDLWLRRFGHPQMSLLRCAHCDTPLQPPKRATSDWLTVCDCLARILQTNARVAFESNCDAGGVISPDLVESARQYVKSQPRIVSGNIQGVVLDTCFLVLILGNLADPDVRQYLRTLKLLAGSDRGPIEEEKSVDCSACQADGKRATVSALWASHMLRPSYYREVCLQFVGKVVDRQGACV